VAVNVGSLLVSLGLDSGEFKSGLKQAEKEFRRSTKEIEKLGEGLSRVGRNLSLAITAPLTALGVASFKAASDAAELQSAFNETFGAMADDMTAWAEATGDAMGRSTQTIQKAANTFGIFFNQAAPTKQAAADLAKQFAVLAQDLGSFFNVDPSVALQKLRSGLSGESEPLRDFGVFLNEAAVASEALRMGLASSSKALTDQHKILARASLIMKATAIAQGDVGRTADGTANRVVAAKEAFEELQVAIGQKLIPAITPLIQRVTDLLNGFNKLSPGVQTAIVATAGFAAAMGPVLFIGGNIVKMLAPFVAGVQMATAAVNAAGVATTGWSVALATLRASVLTLVQTLGPYVVVLGAIGAVVAALIIRHRDLTTASEKYRKAQEEASKAADESAKLLRKLAEAQGEARKEALAAARAEQQNTLTKLRSAQASVELAKAELLAARARQDVINQSAAIQEGGSASGFLPGSDLVLRADTNLRAATETLQSLTKTLRGYTAAIKAAEAPIGESSAVVANDGKKRIGATGPSAAEIEQRFQDELASYAQQALSSMSQIAANADERAEYELRGVELARIRTLAAIDADRDYNATQKERLRLAVEEVAAREREAIEFQRQLELERDAADIARVQFDSQRELLMQAADMADTQAERKRLALDILKLEQEYRRNQLEMVLASSTASDAEKARAQAILDSLAAIEAGERATTARSNETEVERYLRDLNRSPEQINEAVDRIKINGLESLNDALVDAVVNFRSLADVAKSVVQSILADLLRLQIQQAIIKPLAGALGLGLPPVAGARAMGGPVTMGRTYLVGEKGPELFTASRSGNIISNDDLRAAAGGSGATFNVYVNGPMSDREARRTGNQVGASAARQYALARRTGLAG